MTAKSNSWLLVAASIASLFTMLLSSCSDDVTTASCKVTRDADGGDSVTIACADGTKVVIDEGTEGSACTVEDNGDDTKTVRCDDGTSVTVSSDNDGVPGGKGDDGMDGADGKTGPKGSKGEDGKDGADAPNLPGAYTTGAGLQLAITGVTIPDDRQPVVSVTIEDDAGHPLDRTGTFSPGSVSASFVLAYLSSSGGAIGPYVPYNTAQVAGVTVDSVPPVLANATQPRSESDGTWTVVDAATGAYTYRFAKALPSDYDGSKTHTIAVYASRSFEGVSYASNPIHHFRPDGAAVTETREIVTTATCNTCHDTLTAHGGSRRELGLCTTCHTRGMADPESGNSIDLAEMIHKIHSGKSLPSVVGGKPYAIVGRNGTLHDYSSVAFPQPLENCTTCHEGGAHSDRWKTELTREACGSCHDNISFVSPAPLGKVLHTGGQHTTDALCANCHAESMGPIATLVTDVVKAHVTALTDPLSPVLTGEILGITSTGPSDIPVITFKITVDGAAYDILAPGKALSSLRFTFSGPTTDPVNFIQYTAQAGSGTSGMLAAGSQAGEFTWTAPLSISAIGSAAANASGPAIPATGSWAVGMEGRLSGSWKKPNGMSVNTTFPMHNDVEYIAITDVGGAVPRRMATEVERCNDCHDNLTAHGGSRNDPEACVLCHTANLDTIGRMPAPVSGAQATTTPLRLSHMIHRIHTGEAGARPYIAYSPSSSIDFSEVRFPGDRRVCTNCHVEDQYALPLAEGLIASRYSNISSTKTRVTNYYQGATAAACTGCHDSEQTEVHAATMTLGSPATGVESCSTCHAAGKTYGIDIVHARPGL